ncbi:dimethylamine monooxygenase subunit DmmA family protein [Pseudomonas sp. LRF_L74]|uniref:dimethylamine monooxygenase subunit DmmA family protein n=1 Tax=Pseudomonas sp. LRF_L74 TaxID=3369422 RepID=UPI003F5FDA22
MSSIAEVRPFSLPRYPSRQPGEHAAHYLLVTQDDGQARRAELTTYAALSHLALPRYADLDALRQALAERLESGQVGLQLELRGDEAFLWSLRGTALEAGLLADEIILDCTAPDRRTLFCVHCSTLQPGTAADLHTCCACGVTLEVRRHFSERLGAYLGVCADADRPYAEGRP